ncbi:MAG: GAF domain-containing protein, partial [Myxococcota bacterium]
MRKNCASQYAGGLDSWALNADLQKLEAAVDRLAVRSEALSEEVDSATVGEAVEALIRQGVVDTACDLLHARRASLLLLDTVGDHLVVVASSGEWSVPAEIDPIRCDQGVSGLVFERAEATQVTDMGADPVWAPLRRPDRYRGGSFVAVPVMKEEELAGLLFVTEPIGRRAFRKADLSLLRLAVQPLAERLRSPQPAQAGAERLSASDLRGAANLLSSLSPSALTAEVLPKSESEDELDRDAEIAREVCQSVADEVDPSRVMAVALSRVAALLPAAPVSLYLVDASSGQLRCEASLDGGVGEDRLQLRPQRGLTGVAVQTGQLVASADPSSDPRFDPEVDT